MSTAREVLATELKNWTLGSTTGANAAADAALAALAAARLQVVPVEPTPEMLGAWYRHKTGFHFSDEPEPSDTSDVGAYRAMLAASAPPALPKQGEGG